MTDIGDVAKSVVIEVLRAHGVEVSEQQDGEPGMMLLVKGDLLEVRDIPERASKRLLQYFSRTYKIPIHHFYNPQMLPDRLDPPKLPN
ncbi:MAG: hypothetical protein ABSD88_15860 [Candidatus Korobacteraceae bacterium]|jgi:hypothetical protein